MAQAKQTQVRDLRKRELVVDDHAVVRFGISQLINQESDLVVAARRKTLLMGSAPSSGSSRTWSSRTFRSKTAAGWS